MDIVEENADEDANIIFGTTTSEDIPIDEVKLTIIATGFEDPSDAEVIQDSKKSNSKQPTKPVLKKPVQSSLLGRMGSEKVVGGYNNRGSDDYLDTPTFLRKQMD
jgi:cell division protein FtsZ